MLCVDDHAVLVKGLKAQFAIDDRPPRINLVGALASAANPLEETARLQPNVVLLDIEMPGPDVFEVADRIHVHRLGRRLCVIDPKDYTMSDAVAFMTGAKAAPGLALA